MSSTFFLCGTESLIKDHGILGCMLQKNPAADLFWGSGSRVSGMASPESTCADWRLLSGRLKTLSSTEQWPEWTSANDILCVLVIWTISNWFCMKCRNQWYMYFYYSVIVLTFWAKMFSYLQFFSPVFSRLSFTEQLSFYLLTRFKWKRKASINSWWNVAGVKECESLTVAT